MKNFFKMIFASCLGVVLGSVVLIFLGFLLIAGLVASLSFSSDEPVTLRDNTILKVDVHSISEIVMEDPIDQLLSFKKKGREAISLTDAILAIRTAKNNPNIRGIYLNVEEISAGMATIDELRRALIDFKGSGKFVYAYADNYSQKAYYLSSIADKILLNPEGGVALMGIASGSLMMRPALDNLGIKMEVFKVGTYKGAVEPYILDRLSDPNREQIQAYVDGLWTNIVEGIAAARELSADSLRRFVDRGDFLEPASKLLAQGLVDSLVYRTGVERIIADEALSIDKKKLRMITLNEMAILAQEASFGAHRIAVVYAEGEITDAPDVNLYGQSSNHISYELATKLRELAENKTVKAVVLRINSPGGSAFVSEQIWREVMALKQHKPVVVSMGDLAASGGYYIASAANIIVAEANTLTGSIGIFGLVPNAEQLARRVGVSMDVVKTSQFADLEIGGPMGLNLRPMSPQSKAKIQSMVERGYRTFLSRVAEGRAMSLEGVDAIGQGRVWLGSKALELGLVDTLGGLNTAIEEAAKLAELEDYVIDYGTRRISLLEELLSSSVPTDRFVARAKYWLMTPRERELMQLLEQTSQYTGIQARLSYGLMAY